MKATIVVMAIAACGSTAKQSSDAAGTGTDAAIVAASVTISGTATSHGLAADKPITGATITIYRAADDDALLDTITAADGTFTLTVPTHGQALDVYLRATDPTYVDSFLYPTAPLIADFSSVPVYMMTGAAFNSLSTLAQGNQQNSNGLIAVVVEDASGTPVAGATVSSTPTATVVRYDGTGSLGLPSSTATATADDGLGYLFNEAVGVVQISASKSCAAFEPHALKAWANALTGTLITP